jgi:hypothetical protein
VLAAIAGAGCTPIDAAFAGGGSSAARAPAVHEKKKPSVLESASANAILDFVDMSFVPRRAARDLGCERAL